MEESGYGSEYALSDKQAVLKDAIRRMEPVHSHWRMLESLYRTGAQRELTIMDVNRILPFSVPGSFLRTVNMLLPHLTLVINSVASRDPKMVVTPLGGDPEVIERNATIAKAVLEYFWRRTDSTNVLRDMTQDMVVVGNGFCKVGWVYSATDVERSEEDVVEELSELMQMAESVAFEMGQTLAPDEITEIAEWVSLTQQLVNVDEPYVEYVSPYDVFLPADARRMNQTRWVAQRLRLPVEELKANPLFDKEALEALTPDTAYADRETLVRYEDSAKGLPEAFTQATVYEFYDMKARTLCVFQLDAEKPLYEGPVPFLHRYPPFVHMRNFNDGGSSFWSFGDVENVAGLQLMINEIMVSELSDLKRVGNKYFINSKVLTADVRKALSSAEPDQVIPLDVPSSMSLNEVMVPVQRLATPSDNYMMEGKLQDYMQRIIGVTDLQTGAMSVASRVPATAAAAVEGASTTRALDKVVNVEGAAKEVAGRLLALCQQFLDEDRAVRIAGPAAPMWLNVSSDDIEGEFQIETEGGSMSAVNPATRQRQAVDIIQSIVPVLAQLGFDPTNALRTAISWMDLNPDHMVVPPAPEPGPEMGPGGPVSEADALSAMSGGGMPPGVPGPSGGLDGLLPVDELGNPDMSMLADIGAPPVPAGTDGEIAL
jgi:hypothetical protein